MKIATLVVVTLLLQRLLGAPGLPAWTPELVLPMVLVVAYSLVHHDRKWPYAGIVLGLLWDLIMGEKLIGPGGIAWGAAFVSVQWLGQFVADRRTRSWALAGAFGTAVLVLARELALLPLGHASGVYALSALRSMLLTGLWCGLCGALIRLDLPRRLQEYQARKLR